MTDHGAQINYKDFQPHEEKIKTHAIEYETNVDSSYQLQKILNALNFTKLVEVKKHRRSWNYEHTEISLDSVEGIGDYIEVKYKGNLQDIETVRKHLLTVLGSINAQTGELEHRGYPHFVLAKQGLL